MTSAQLTDEDLHEFRAVVAEQAATRIAPLAAEVDRSQRFSPELWTAVRDLGLFSLPFAQQHGGAGGTVSAYVAATEEVARHCAVAALYPGTTIQVAMTLLAHGTPEQVAAHVPAGIGRAAVDEAADYAITREHRGEPIGERFPTIQALLGAAAARVFGAAALVSECARLLDANGDVTTAAAAARLVSARAAREAALAALHVCGAYGLTRDLPVERLYREAVFFDVAQGVAEIQQLIVARAVLARARQRTYRTGVQR